MHETLFGNLPRGKKARTEEMMRRLQSMNQKQLEKLQDQMTGIPFNNLKKLHAALHTGTGHKLTQEDKVDAFNDICDIAGLIADVI